MKISVIIDSVSKKENVVSELGFQLLIGLSIDESSGEFELGSRSIFSKSKLIEFIGSLKDSGNEVSIRTVEGVEVDIIDNRYFRTDGDTNDKNDLLDLPSC